MQGVRVRPSRLWAHWVTSGASVCMGAVLTRMSFTLLPELVPRLLQLTLTGGRRSNQCNVSVGGGQGMRGACNLMRL